ncbi:hypothetical protein N9D45_07050 [Gammaproteobacteria bacterium]|jgi:hypothetical protein|nr:hypothetical protein [Gammaproteobacteria bacterium]
MSKISIVLNSFGIVVSSTCFIHCVFVILLFLNLTTTVVDFEFFADDFNHLILILSSLFLATLSQIKIVRDAENHSFRGIQVMMQKQLFFSGTILMASLLVENIFSEILVICGALIILSMHVKKLLSSH